MVNAGNLEDIAYYNEQLREINNLYKENISIILLGYKPELDKDMSMAGINFQYSKPVSIIHWYKELKSREIDLLFIPLIQNIFNDTSENLKKYIDAGENSIPVIVCNAFPYKNVIQDGINGFVYNKREDFIYYLKNLLSKGNFPLVKICGEHAYQDAIGKFSLRKNRESLLRVIAFHENDSEVKN